MNPEQKKIINRLKRLEGQVRGVERMVDRNESIKNIFTQTRAMKSALVAIEQSLIDLEFTQIENTVADVNLLNIQIKELISYIK